MLRYKFFFYRSAKRTGSATALIVADKENQNQIQKMGLGGATAICVQSYAIFKKKLIDLALDGKAGAL